MARKAQRSLLITDEQSLDRQSCPTNPLLLGSCPARPSVTKQRLRPSDAVNEEKYKRWLRFLFLDFY